MSLTLPIFPPAGDDDIIPIAVLSAVEVDGWLASQPDITRHWVERHRFQAARDEVLSVPAHNGHIAIILAGLGGDDIAAVGPWFFAKIAATVPGGRYRLDAPLPASSADLAVLGWCLQQYRFDRYKTDKPSEPRLLECPVGIDLAALQTLVEAIFLIRDLVNTPAADMGPAELAAAARGLAERHDAAMTEIIGDDLLSHRLNAIHTVGRGSARPPRLVEFEWGDPAAPRLTVIGKGVCFDSGGLDIKPSGGMRDMKKDMGGAAHALALAHLVMSEKLPVRLRVLIPAVENSVSGNAYRPGDVIATRKGLRVEIENTDAEGRLVLADALALADEDAPDLIIDFATLTGAARVALGPDIPPFFTDDEEIAAALGAAAQATCDPVWRLPLWTPYLDDLKSPIADIANSSTTGFAGAITAALFLRKFLAEQRRWMHLDIFAWNKKSRPGRPPGGEAMALRAVFAMLKARYPRH
ncbi:MAG: leucyl aminopeptidase family protein [Sphingomonadales bacterium]|nr:leucyl aminopeptidase family protein [Sphingomonadales bacterium]